MQLSLDSHSRLVPGALWYPSPEALIEWTLWYMPVIPATLQRWGDHSSLPVQDPAQKIKTKSNCKFSVTFLTLCCLWSSYKTPHMVNVFDPQLVESLNTQYWDTKKWWYLFSTHSCHEIHSPLSIFSLNLFLAPSATTLSDSHWV